MKTHFFFSKKMTEKKPWLILTQQNLTPQGKNMAALGFVSLSTCPTGATEKKLREVVHDNILLFSRYHILASVAFPLLPAIFQRVIMKQNTSSMSLLARTALLVGVPSLLYRLYILCTMNRKNPFSDFALEGQTALLARKVTASCTLLALVALANRRFQLAEGRFGSLVSHSCGPMFYVAVSTLLTNLFIKYQVHQFQAEMARRRQQNLSS